jgi:hypothetical protein
VNTVSAGSVSALAFIEKNYIAIIILFLREQHKCCRLVELLLVVLVVVVVVGERIMGICGTGKTGACCRLNFKKFLRNVNVWNEKLGFIWMLLDICLSMALIISSNTKMMLLQLGVMF